MNFARRAWPAVRTFLRHAGAVAWRALVKYDETDGEQRAASFAYYAFFALFPLLVLLITVGAMFLKNPEYAQVQITHQMHEHMPVDPDTLDRVIKTIQGVVQSRGRASLIAFAVLAWSAIRFFQALVRGVNKAWGTHEYSWWRLPIKNLAMVAILASALLLGVIAPALLNQMEYVYLRAHLKYAEVHLATVKAGAEAGKAAAEEVAEAEKDLKTVREGLEKVRKNPGIGPADHSATSSQTDPVSTAEDVRGPLPPLSFVFRLLRALLPPLVLFYGFLMFYKFAPQRRTRFREIWLAALFTTIGLDLLQRAFVLYTKNIANFNALYGTFGSVVALLMWIYLSGALIILGGCLAAAQYEIRMSLADQSERERHI